MDKGRVFNKEIFQINNDDKIATNKEITGKEVTS